jgi:hypothetical protein
MEFTRLRIMRGVTDEQAEPVPVRLELGVSDPSRLSTVRDHLARIPGVTVRLLPRPAGPGRLGTSDVLEVLAGGSGVLAVALRMLPEIIRAARTDFTIHVRSGDREVTLTAANADDVVKLLGVPDDE